MTENAKTIADAYHQSWTSKRFDEAIAILAPDVAVEVPINDYPTRESFGDALRSFGSMVESVDLLAALSGDSDAMLLYDMEVRGLGTLRVAEHLPCTTGALRVSARSTTRRQFARRVSGVERERAA